MKIQIGSLSEGIHTYQFDEKASEVGLRDEYTGNVYVEATLDKTPNQIALRGNIQATGRFNCDRCATAFDTGLSATYRMFYVWDGMEVDDRLDPSEVQVIPHGVSIIDIADDVRQTMVLAVPLKLLCRENCRGLCPTCGTDLNTSSCQCEQISVDSRWDALRRLSSGTDRPAKT